MKGKLCQKRKVKKSFPFRFPRMKKWSSNGITFFPSSQSSFRSREFFCIEFSRIRGSVFFFVLHLVPRVSESCTSPVSSSSITIIKTERQGFVLCLTWKWESRQEGMKRALRWWDERREKKGSVNRWERDSTDIQETKWEKNSKLDRRKGFSDSSIVTLNFLFQVIIFEERKTRNKKRKLLSNTASRLEWKRDCNE